MKYLNQRGDSIVEVLIAIAIVSLVLVSAYVVTNKNTLAIQSTQERIQAQHLVEAQIEALRAQGGLNTAGDCFNGATETGACDNFTQAGSGATYSIDISDPVANVYTITATWTSQNSTTPDDSNVVMVYRLN